jgi:hypothetical protein
VSQAKLWISVEMQQLQQKCNLSRELVAHA